MTDEITTDDGHTLRIVNVDDLHEDPKNARRHPKRNAKAVNASLSKYGQAQTLCVQRGTGLVIGGNCTLAELRAMGRERVAVLEGDWEGHDATGLGLALNRAAELAAWDEDALAEQLSELLDAGDPLAELGWSDKDMRDLFPPDEIDEDEAPDVQDEVITQRGDLWVLGEHRVLCGDSKSAEDVGRLLGEESPDMVLTDPPYCSGGFQEAGKKAGSVGTRGDEMVANDTLSTRGYTALIKEVLHRAGAGVVYLFTDWRMWVNLSDVVESSGYGVRAMVVWDKGTAGMGRGWRSQHELILCGTRVTLPFDPGKAQGNVIQATRTGNKNHPTEKPVDLLFKILDVTDICRTVYDPFLGSGGTLSAAEQLGRRCYGMEIEPKYVDVTIRRWMALTGKVAIRDGDGFEFPRDEATG